jgi:hypothetical protein
MNATKYKVKNMKNIWTLCMLLITASAVAQIHSESPLKNHKDFELSKPVKYVKIGTYDASDKGWDPVSMQVISFNDTDQLVQEYLRILGKFGSETAYNYVYDGKKLDSVNTLASAANFNIKGDITTDKNGRIISETAKGFYADYTKSYQYNKDGTVKAITTKHATGSNNWAQFTYKNGKLDMVTQVDGKVYKGSPVNYFLYNNGLLFAKWNNLDIDLLLSPTSYRHYKLKKHSTPQATAQELRKLFNTDKKAYDMRLDKLVDTENIVYEQTTSSNEQGDWNKKMTKTLNYGQEQRRWSFREIVYMDGSTSGSTDFDSFFYERMKKL